MIKSRISVCLLATAVIGSFAVLPAAEAKGDVADVVFQQLSGQLLQTVTDCKADMMDRANDCVAQMSDLISQGNPQLASEIGGKCMSEVEHMAKQAIGDLVDLRTKGASVLHGYQRQDLVDQFEVMVQVGIDRVLDDMNDALDIIKAAMP